MKLLKFLPVIALMFLAVNCGRSVHSNSPSGDGTPISSMTYTPSNYTVDVGTVTNIPAPVVKNASPSGFIESKKDSSTLSDFGFTLNSTNGSMTSSTTLPALAKIDTPYTFTIEATGTSLSAIVTITFSKSGSIDHITSYTADKFATCNGDRSSNPIYCSTTANFSPTIQLLSTPTVAMPTDGNVVVTVTFDKANWMTVTLPVDVTKDGNCNTVDPSTKEVTCVTPPPELSTLPIFSIQLNADGVLQTQPVKFNSSMFEQVQLLYVGPDRDKVMFSKVNVKLKDNSVASQSFKVQKSLNLTPSVGDIVYSSDGVLNLSVKKVDVNLHY